MHIENKKSAITKHKNFHFNLPRDIENNFKDKIDYIKIYYEPLADQRKKQGLGNHCPNITMGMIFMNTENSKMYESHKFVLNLSQKLDLSSDLTTLFFKT